MRLSDLATNNRGGGWVSDLATKAAKAVEKISTPVRPDATRPARLDDMIGQSAVVAQLRVMIEAAKFRGTPVDHLLFTGPGGTGKTTLALMVQTEMGAPDVITTTAPALNIESLG